MGKYEAAPRKADPSENGKKKKHIGLWITLAVLLVIVAWGVWFFTSPPPQDVIGPSTPSDDSVTPPDDPGSSTPSGTVAADPVLGDEPEPLDTVKELKEGFYTILLAGTVDNYNTDTLMLCSVDTKVGTVKLVSINRDTQVDASITIPKINAMYGWKGAETMCQKVTELTGIPINDYVVINMDSFIQVIDMIGGVEYNVPFDMVHPDLDKTFDINLPAGQRTLSGKEALQFVRYRSTSENDFGRVNRQKDFLVAAVKQVLQKFSLSQIEDYIRIFNENVETSLTIQEMVWYLTNVAAKLDFAEDVTSDTLPYATTGYWTNPNATKYATQSYVYLDPQQVVDYVNENLNPYTTDLTVDDVHIPRWINE